MIFRHLFSVHFTSVVASPLYSSDVRVRMQICVMRQSSCRASERVFAPLCSPATGWQTWLLHAGNGMTGQVPSVLHYKQR